MEEFDKIGEELRKERIKLKNYQRRMRIYTTKHHNCYRKIQKLELELKKLGKNKVEKVVTTQEYISQFVE